METPGKVGVVIPAVFRTIILCKCYISVSSLLSKIKFSVQKRGSSLRAAQGPRLKLDIGLPPEQEGKVSQESASERNPLSARARVEAAVSGQTA